jgi:methionyl-tRNA formyltransferase
VSLRVFVLSNDDLTSNVIFAPLFEIEEVEVVGLAFTATILSGRRGGAAMHALLLLRRTDPRFWIYQVFVNGAYKLSQTCCRVGGDFPSLRKLSAERGIPVATTANFSSPEFIRTLREARPSLIVIRMNQLLIPEVLNVAPYGVWCAHSSILPAYGGIAAELQGLANGDTSVGTTIFRVTAELDAGDPLVQHVVPISPRTSLFAAILANNRAGGALLRRAVESLARTGRVEPELVAPPPSSYYSWPTRGDVRRFRARGHRLMRIREVGSYLRSLLT